MRLRDLLPCRVILLRAGGVPFGFVLMVPGKPVDGERWMTDAFRVRIPPLRHLGCWLVRKRLGL